MGSGQTFMDSGFEHRVEALVEGLGFELVTLERGGTRRRPLLRVRIDRPSDQPGPSDVTTEDCALVSRTLQRALDERQEYLLEVSSPGVERPLVRAGDYRRFAGRPVVVRGFGPLSGSSKQIEGKLLGLVEDGQAIALEVGGERVGVPLAAIARATLAYRMEEDL